MSEPADYIIRLDRGDGTETPDDIIERELLELEEEIDLYLDEQEDRTVADLHAQMKSEWPTNGIWGDWNKDQKIKYKGGIMTYFYKLYDPEALAAFNEKWAEFRGYPLRQLDVKWQVNYISRAVMYFAKLHWIEQLGLSAETVLGFIDKTIFKPINGMNRVDARIHMGLWGVQTSEALQIDFGSTEDPAGYLNVQAQYANWENWAMQSGGYRPQSTADFFTNFFDMKTVYTLLAIYTAPQMIEALPESFEFLQEAVPDLIEFLGKVKDKAGEYVKKNYGGLNPDAP